MVFRVALQDSLKSRIQPLRENLTSYKGIQQTLYQSMKHLKVGHMQLKGEVLTCLMYSPVVCKRCTKE